MRIHRAATVLVLLFAADIARAQGASGRDSRFDEQELVTGDLGEFDDGDPAGSARRALGLVRGAAPAKAAEALAAVRVERDAFGVTHVRLQQRRKGLPVVGGEVVVHAREGRVFAVNGKLAPLQGELPREPRLPAEEALVQAAAAAEITRWEPTGDLELVYAFDAEGRVRLAWSLSAAYEDRHGNPRLDRLFADAFSGELVALQPQIHYARNRQTHDAGNGTSLPGTLVLDEVSGATGDAILQAAHDHAGIVYDYLAAVHGRDSLDGAGRTIRSSVHYRSGYSNAFWNGTQVVYGDGDGFDFAPLALALDVTAHELTHAVTEATADLVFAGEAGALNEALSDVFAAAIESWSRGGVAAETWRLGEDVYTPATPGDAFRYLDSPTLDGSSRDYYPERAYPGCTTPSGGNDNCGVHSNSGIAALAFKLLVTGGTHPRGRTTVVVPALGMQKAEAIFYQALAHYLTSTSNFAAARSATAQAAVQLYGNGSAEAAAVHLAWDAVGVPGSPTPSPEAEPLTNGVPVGIADSTAGERRFELEVPAGAATLTFSISGGSGDADLYVKRGTPPTRSSFDCRSYRANNAEACSFPSPQSGTWYVMVYAYASYSGASLVGSYDSTPGNAAPSAAFTATANGLTVQLTDTSTDPDGKIVSRRWLFGDGGAATEANPVKTYLAAGTYLVTLTVTDDGGKSSSTQKKVTVAGACAGTLVSGTLSFGGSAIEPGGKSYTAASPGRHEAWLDGSGGDLDLYLQRWNGSTWVNVASATTTAADERISYLATLTGQFRYRVVAYSGSGSYSLCFTAPADGTPR